MREGYINRMNFLKQGGKGLTYKTLLYALIAWFAILVMIYGLQFLRYWRLDSSIEEAKAEVARLDQEKERQIELVKLMGKRRIGLSSQENLTSIITNRPRWSRMLKGIVSALPADVWLDSVSVTGGGEEWYTMLIKGQAKTRRSLTNFILRLESSGLFSKTALDNTKLVSGAGGEVNYELRTQPVMKKLMTDA